MSQQALEAVVGRAILDEDFRLHLFADPLAALSGYELSAAETAALMSVERDMRVTRIAVATDSSSAGIWATRPSPMVSRV